MLHAENEPTPGLPIPWEDMLEQCKEVFFEMAKRGDINEGDVVPLSNIFLLFPKLAEEVAFTTEDFERCIDMDPEDDDIESLQGFLRIFPNERQRILEVFDKGIQKAEKKLKEASEQVPPAYTYCLYVLSMLPGRFDQYKDMLNLGKEAVLYYIRADDVIARILPLMSALVLFFPDTREQVQSILRDRRTEILKYIQASMEDPELNTDTLASSLADAKIIYAESAGFRPDGTIFIEDKKSLGPRAPELPVRQVI